ncbi:hypothetical protein A9G83_000699 [Salmonella enterica subsp. enterica serovar Sundsvall]|nr:hypothetical protein [Salmonella enterica subsp. enterica serovar Sundsvall]
MTPELYQQQQAELVRKLEAKVNELVRRGLKRRAAMICLELIDAAETSAQRQKFAQLRGMLIRSSNCGYGRGSNQTWYLAGNYTGAQ